MSANLSKSMTGADVVHLQRMLNCVVVQAPRLELDGVFGSKTLASVMTFQKGCSLAPDGIVGPLTRKSLFKSVFGGFLLATFGNLVPLRGARPK